LTALRIDIFGFIGELSLNAELRACRVLLPMVLAAKYNGIRNIVVLRDNFRGA